MRLSVPVGPTVDGSENRRDFSDVERREASAYRGCERRAAAFLAALLTILALAAAAHAEFPLPVDPNRCDNSGMPPGCTPLPNELGGTAGDCSGLNWKYASTSFCTTDPLIKLSANELLGVSGMSVDTAWRRTTGRSDVVIAVLDSGIKWNDGGAVADLRNKWKINRGELPQPSPCAGLGTDAYDCNGDGVFNTPDYDDDPRVTDTNGNGAKDPQDLIHLFSDGVDGDGDGYTDNICGWDFFQYDNDPFDDVQYGHGTGESRDSAAESNNGGDAGACPNCMSLPIRVGDSFVADINAFAQAVVFAVDTGASVVQEALGTYNNSRFGQEAVTYAYRHGVVVMASAADEDAWHHNFPSSYVHTIVANSIRDFGVDGVPVQPASWLYFNGCTNFGGNISVSVSSTSCSSEAVGRSSGITGLLISAGRDAADAHILDHPLTPNEVRQLHARSADDIDFELNRAVSFPDTVRYATQDGWDQFTGYGRVNATRAVDAIFAGTIPPEAEIDEPSWFAYLDAERDGAFDVRGRVAADRASGYTYRVQIGYGIQPRESDYTDIVAFGATKTAPTDGVLATIRADQIPAPTAEQVSRRLTQLPDVSSDYDEFTYTVRVQVRDQPGNLLGEDRRTVFVHHDADLKAGFPVTTGDGASSPAIADLDGDGVGEIVIGSSDGVVHAIRSDGSELAGWPVATDPLPLRLGSAGYSSGELTVPVGGAVLASVAIGDLDGDGSLDVVAADLEGKVYAWNRLGQRRPGFPVSVNPAYSSSAVLDPANTVDVAVIASPALADLDGDGTLDIIAGANDRHVYVWNDEGALRSGFPLLVVDPARMASIDPVTHKVTPLAGAYRGSKIMTSPAVGDIDGDGSLDIVVGTNEAYDEEPNVTLTNATLQAVSQSGLVSPGNTRVYAIHKDGALHAPSPFLPGWPAKIAQLMPELLPDVGEGVNASPALADIDGDGKLEIGIFASAGPGYMLRADGTSFYGTDPNGKYNVLATEGYPAANSADTPSITNLGEGAFGDLAGLGELSFAAPSGGLMRLLAIVIPEQQITAEDHVGAWNARTGEWEPAFPRHNDDLSFLMGPSIADVGGTPLPEVVLGSAGYFVNAYDASGVQPPGWPKFTGGWHIANAAVGDVDGDGLAEVVSSVREGSLFVWDTTAPAAAGQWPKKRHDLRNTGNYEEAQGQTASEVFQGELQVESARMSLKPDQDAADRLTARIRITTDSDGGGIDPAADGFALAFDAAMFTIPAAAISQKNATTWEYKDGSGAGSSPPGLTRATLKQADDGSISVRVKGRDLDLAAFHGEEDMVIRVAFDSGNDHAEADATFTRANPRTLKTP
ncbi:MAG TPA: FG-GAP-like repeat-containing protein [Candidatus Limnocylindrales bacterium]|nr:FG-GAP-like repeat-containing protein [Candidatus Limnocylindrales bacterium]